MKSRIFETKKCHSRIAGWLLSEIQSVKKYNNGKPLMYVTDQQFTELVREQKVQMFAIDPVSGKYNVSISREEEKSIPRLARRNLPTAMYAGNLAKYLADDIVLWDTVIGQENALTVSVNNIWDVFNVPLVSAFIYASYEFDQAELDSIKALKSTTVTPMGTNAIMVVGPKDSFHQLFWHFDGRISICTASGDNLDNPGYRRKLFPGDEDTYAGFIQELGRKHGYLSRFCLS